jgi:hypothetical protein
VTPLFHVKGNGMSAPVSAQNVNQLIAPSPRTTGSVLWAPQGTTLPTTSFATLMGGTISTGFSDLGFLDENGIKQKENRATTDVFAWGGDLVGTLQDKYDRTLTFKLMQFDNAEVLAVGYGIDNVTMTAASTSEGVEIAVAMNANLLDTRSWVFDGIYNQQLARIVIPIGRVITLGELDTTQKAFMTLECNLKAYPDSLNNHGYMYFNNGMTT